MPKFSLKRRHRRQHDLSLLQQSPVDSLNRETAARKVSDDDITHSSSPEASCDQDVVVLNLCTKASTEDHPPSSCGGTDSVQALPRLVESSFSLCLSPRAPRDCNDDDTAKRRLSCTSPSSPWGQFVDMVVPASSTSCSDEDFDSSSPRSSSGDEPRESFLPLCPHHHHHPYRRPTKARRLGKDHRQAKSSNLSGFFLQAPDQSSSTSTQTHLIDETQDALECLRF